MKEERKEVKREKGATHRIKKREREISKQKEGDEFSSTNSHRNRPKIEQFSLDDRLFFSSKKTPRHARERIIF